MRRPYAETAIRKSRDDGCFTSGSGLRIDWLTTWFAILVCYLAAETYSILSRRLS
jgi:hypothetical protein